MCAFFFLVAVAAAAASSYYSLFSSLLPLLLLLLFLSLILYLFSFFAFLLHSNHWLQLLLLLFAMVVESLFSVCGLWMKISRCYWTVPNGGKIPKHSNYLSPRFYQYICFSWMDWFGAEIHIQSWPVKKAISTSAFSLFFILPTGALRENVLVSLSNHQNIVKYHEQIQVKWKLCGICVRRWWAVCFLLS